MTSCNSVFLIKAFELVIWEDREVIKFRFVGFTVDLLNHNLGMGQES